MLSCDWLYNGKHGLFLDEAELVAFADGFIVTGENFDAIVSLSGIVRSSDIVHGGDGGRDDDD